MIGDDDEMMIIGVPVMAIAMATAFATVDFRYSKCGKL